MIEDSAIYRELANLKLENRLLSERLDMHTRALNTRAEERMSLCEQLDKLGFTITNNNQIVEKA